MSAASPVSVTSTARMTVAASVPCFSTLATADLVGDATVVLNGCGNIVENLRTTT